MIDKNRQTVRRISIRIADSDTKKLKFIMKTLGKNQSEALREAINYLYNDVISGKFEI